MKHSDAGNVLFLILIAVVLFAALSYVVTSSTRVGGASISKEKADLLAAQIINQFVAFDTAIHRVIAGGCTVDQLNAYSVAYTRRNGTPIGSVNPKSPSDGRCNLWDGSQYPLPYLYAPRDALDETIAYTPTNSELGHYYVVGTNVVNVGSDLNDLTIILANVKRDVCLSMIRKLGISLTDIPLESNTNRALNASFDTATTSPDKLGDEVPELAGHFTIPFNAPALGTSHCAVYHVSIAR